MLLHLAQILNGYNFIIPFFLSQTQHNNLQQSEARNHTRRGWHYKPRQSPASKTKEDQKIWYTCLLTRHVVQMETQTIIPYVMTWDGVMIICHKKYIRQLEKTPTNRGIHPVFNTKEDLETIYFEHCRGTKDGLKWKMSFNKHLKGKIKLAMGKVSRLCRQGMKTYIKPINNLRILYHRICI